MTKLQAICFCAASSILVASAGVYLLKDTIGWKAIFGLLLVWIADGMHEANAKAIKEIWG
jgi:hypothetical protein